MSLFTGSMLFKGRYICLPLNGDRAEVIYLFRAEDSRRRGLLTTSSCCQCYFPGSRKLWVPHGCSTAFVPQHEESRTLVFDPRALALWLGTNWLYFLQFCIRSVVFKTWPNMDALRTLLKPQIPGSHFKSLHWVPEEWSPGICDF